MNQQEQKTIRLKKPITLKGDSVTYETITLREPTIDELDRSSQVAGSSYACNAALISMVAGIPLAVARQMTKSLYEEATTFLSGFTWEPPQSGATSGTDGPTSPGSTDGDQTPPAA